MITNNDILNMNFYKKEKFNGSFRGMRYLIQKASEELPLPADAAPDAVPEKKDIFRVAIWPGPYIFSVTPEEQKNYATFPFTEEGKQQVVDWLNEQWALREKEWPVTIKKTYD
jgi:hypothetical protein